jgi:hypothetical protein
MSVEIFVLEGLEGALNIDRESFNFAHPHAVYLTKWVHSALRRLTNIQKGIAADARADSRNRDRSEQQAKRESGLEDAIADAWATATKDDDVAPIRFSISAASEPLSDADSIPIVSTSFADILPRQRAEMEAIASILAAYSCLDNLSPSQQESVLLAIHRVLVAGGDS